MLAGKLREDQGNYKSSGPSVMAPPEFDSGGNSFQLFQISVTIVRAEFNLVLRVGPQQDYRPWNLFINTGG
jgi:hypothetical protein